MHRHPPIFSPASWLAALLLAPLTPLAAWAAPGEDPLVLTQRSVAPLLPGPPAPKSVDANRITDMPAWLRARVVRYEAKAMQDLGGKSILTDSDVVTQAQSQGMNKTCIQDVGSIAPSAGSGFNQYGPKGQDQVVVLRGDLVNVCK